MRSGLIVLSLVVAAAFAPYMLRSGIYLDDQGFLLALHGAGWDAFLNYFLSYVPGRNIQIAYWWALINGTGASAFWMHACGLLITWATAAPVQANITA